MRKFATLWRRRWASCVHARDAGAPSSADAGWRRKAWRDGYGPGVSVYVGPRYGYYAPRRAIGYDRPLRGYPYAYYPYWRKRYWRGWY